MAITTPSNFSRLIDLYNQHGRSPNFIGLVHEEGLYTVAVAFMAQYGNVAPRDLPDVECNIVLKLRAEIPAQDIVNAGILSLLAEIRDSLKQRR